MDANILIAIATSIAAAIFYSVIAFGKSWLNKPESFEPKRMIRTIVQSIFIGVWLWWMGLAVTAETFIAGDIWLTTAGLNIIVDIFVILILRVKEKFF